MKCQICNTNTDISLTHTVRDKYEAKYALCPKCDFLQVIEPSWITEAYSNPINITDTGYVMRNIYLSRKTLILFLKIFNSKNIKNEIFLDYAGGYGMFTRIMRDYGLDFLWSDLYTKNLFSQGFEYTNQKISAITCFECFEHFLNPITEIEKILSISDTVFFSTRLKPKNITPNKEWEYYGFNHGQHLSFYSEKTLKFIASKYNLNYYTDKNDLHIFTKKNLNKNILKMVNLFAKLQLDILLKKTLKSKTSADQKALMTKGL